MPTMDKGGSRVLLRTLRAAMASPGEGQQRLDKVVHLVASNMVAEVCSIYLKRDERTLELCATEGLKKDAVHRVRLRVGQGLVGRIAESAQPIATADAFGGTIITDWYSLPESPNERFKLNVFILDRALRADGVKVSVFKQVRDSMGQWVDYRVEPKMATDLENAILTRARQLRIVSTE